MRRSAYSRGILLLIGAVALTVVVVIIAGGALPAREESASPTATSTPRREERGDFNTGQCVRVVRPTYLRFGPGIDFPVFTNVPAQPQPPMTIIEAPRIGLTCFESTQCNPRDEGWWWPVQITWPDTGDQDRGWLWQGDLKACR